MGCQAIRIPFPLHAPAIARTIMAMVSELDMPQSRLVIIVNVRPNIIVGLRPNLSEALPQIMAVKHCANEKTADVIPAHFATSFLRTPKLSIISG